MKNRQAFAISAFVQSEIPLTDKVMSVLEVRVIVIDDYPPDAELCHALVSAHTRNCEILACEVHSFEIPDDLIS